MKTYHDNVKDAELSVQLVAFLGLISTMAVIAWECYGSFIRPKRMGRVMIYSSYSDGKSGRSYQDDLDLTRRTGLPPQCASIYIRGEFDTSQISNWGLERAIKSYEVDTTIMRLVKEDKLNQGEK